MDPWLKLYIYYFINSLRNTAEQEKWTVNIELGMSVSQTVQAEKTGVALLQMKNFFWQ